MYKQAPVRVLVVEDDAVNRDVASMMLHHFGCTVTAVDSGPAALQAVRDGSHDIVVMDCRMLDMDGLETTRRLRGGEAGPKGIEIPIIALTAQAFVTDREACLGAGMNDFLTKPVDASRLMSALQRWLAPQVASALKQPLQDPAPPLFRDTEEPAVFDPNVLADLPMVADGSQPRYGEVVLGMYFRSAPTLLAMVRQAAMEGDVQKALHAAHTLKSSSAAVGALALSACAASAEAALRAGQGDLSGMPQRLEKELERLCAALGRPCEALPALGGALGKAGQQASRVLIIDDDPLVREMAAHTLRHAGFDVEEAEEGGQGLALIENAAFDLLLLDVMMPGLDGYEVCRRVRLSRHGRRMPILMLTGLNDSESIELAYEAGATDFIGKPINWTLLSHRVRYSLRAGAAIETMIRGRERLERAHHIANMGSWELSADGQRFTCSPELARVLAAPARKVGAAKAEDFIALIGEGDREAILALRRAACTAGKSYQRSFRIRRFDGAVRTVFEQAAAVLDHTGRPVAVEGITQDITDRVEAEEQIKRLAHYDALTGLPNRQFFGELVGPALDRSSRLGTGCAMLYVDMDRFKSVNDAIGYAQGDTVLRLMSTRLKGCIRTSDIATEIRVPNESMVSRVGGNAFTLLLVDIADEQQAAMVAERMLTAIAAPLTMNDQELVLTASIGIALFPRDARDAEGLTRCAEQAAYAAKSAGRARHRFFDEAMNAKASDRLARENDLRRAITEGQLRLFYQPKFDASTGAITGAEALVRWQHPERGMVSPGEFIPLAEETGLILPLTDWVLETACTDLRRRTDAGLCEVPVSVNLSSPSFADDGLRGQLEALLARHRLSPASLILEVTESLLMSDVDRAVLRLSTLREMGFKVSLDDFGTGYSSLGYLKRFPIDELKIDRSFVTDAWRGGRDGAIAVSVIALGRAFGLHVVAEGVETAGQSNFLLAHGCNQQQGFLFAKPMPGADFDALLARDLAAAKEKKAAAAHAG